MASFTSSFQCLPSSPDHDDIQDSQDFSLRMECSQNSVNSSPELPKEKHPRMAGRSLWQPWPQCESPSLLSGACGGPGDDLTPHRTPQNSSTPLPVQSQTKKALEDLFKKQQDWISDKFKEQEEIIQGLFQDRKRERKSRLEEINVPVQIKQAVRDGYRHNDSDNELRWTTKTEAGVVLKYNSEQNKEMTDAILTFVKGQYPSTEEGVIRHGIDVYFNTIKQKRHMEATGKKGSHNRKMVLYSRKHRKKNECEENCEGLSKDALGKTPSDPELLRLSLQFDPEMMHDLAIHLGVTNQEWKYMEKNHPQNAELVNYLILIQWREKHNGKFKNVFNALSDMDVDTHNLCQVRRTKIRQSDLPEEHLGSILDALATEVGSLSFQLGVELGRKNTELETIQYNNKLDLVEQSKEILHNWRDEQTIKATFEVLEQALVNVGRGSMCLKRIMEEVGVKQHKFQQHETERKKRCSLM